MLIINGLGCVAVAGMRPWQAGGHEGEWGVGSTVSDGLRGDEACCKGPDVWMWWCCSYMAANFHEPEHSLLHRFLVARDHNIERAMVRETD